MKPLLTVALLALSGTAAIAQSTTPPAAPEYSRELGLFGQSQVTGGGDNTLSLVGLQYRKMRTEHKGFRLIGGFAQYDSRGSEIRSIKGDTLYSDQQHTTINFPMIGAGLELQRHFYRNISLFAAVELKGGYGTGRSETFTTALGGSLTPGTEQFSIGEKRDANLLYIGATASIGARLQRRRLAIALELLPVQVGYTRLRIDGKPASGISDFNLGSFSQRVSVGWRF